MEVTKRQRASSYCSAHKELVWRTGSLCIKMASCITEVNIIENVWGLLVCLIYKKKLHLIQWTSLTTLLIKCWHDIDRPLFKIYAYIFQDVAFMLVIKEVLWLTTKFLESSLNCSIGNTYFNRNSNFVFYYVVYLNYCRFRYWLWESMHVIVVYRNLGQIEYETGQLTLLFSKTWPWDSHFGEVYLLTVVHNL